MKTREREREEKETPPLTWFPCFSFSCAALCTARRPIRYISREGKRGGIYATSVFKAGLLIRSVHLLSSFFLTDERSYSRGGHVRRRDADPWLALREIERITMGLYLWLRSWSNRFRADCLRSVPIARNAACTIASGTPLIRALHERGLLMASFDMLARVTRVFTFRI